MSKLADSITRDSIAAAYRLIRPHIRRTPVLEASGSDFGLEPVALTFKLDGWLRIGELRDRL